MSTTAAAAAAGGGGVEGTHTTIDNATTTTSIIHNNNNNNQEQEDDNKGNSSSITDQANHEGDTLKVYNTAIVLEEDEMSSGRRIIIHVDIPSILHRSRKGKEQQQYSTDIIVNRWLASMAWGRIDDTTGDWILAVDKISINPPIDENQSSSCNSEHHQQQQDTQQYTTDGVGGEGELANSILITYLEYLENKYIRERGYDNEEEDDDGEVEEVDKEDIINNILLDFTTKKTSPGAKLRGEFDNLIKCCLSLPPSVRKGFGLPNKVNIRQSEADKEEKEEEESKEPPKEYELGIKTIFQYGLYSILPSFINMIIRLTQEKRDFALVLWDDITTTEDDDADDSTNLHTTIDMQYVIEELRLLCEGKHPMYCGKYKTNKVIINGDGNTMNITPQYTHRGILTIDSDTNEPILLFPHRRKQQQGSNGAKTAAAEKEEEAPIDANNNSIESESLMTEYRGYSDVYCGLVHEMIPEGRMVSIMEKNGEEEVRKILINTADTNIQHIYLGKARKVSKLTVMDVLTNTPSELEIGLVVDDYMATKDEEYFNNIIYDAIQQHTDKLRREKEEGAAAAALGYNNNLDRSDKATSSLTPRSYLRQTVLPVLTPAINEVSRDRPKDPITYIAMYMLKHKEDGYSKVVDMNPSEPSTSSIAA